MQEDCVMGSQDPVLASQGAVLGNQAAVAGADQPPELIHILLGGVVVLAWYSHLHSSLQLCFQCLC